MGGYFDQYAPTAPAPKCWNIMACFVNKLARKASWLLIYVTFTDSLIFLDLFKRQRLFIDPIRFDAKVISITTEIHVGIAIY